MKKIFEVALGIVTSIGGFLEIGSITTSAQAGADFGYQLCWAVVLGTVCIAFLAEMAGRFSAVSKHTIPDAMRERFGVNFFAVPLVIVFGVSLLTLGAELGGIAAALELATGIAIPVWAIPAALLVWTIIWRATFGMIENGASLLGLITVSFAVAAVKLHPDYGATFRGFVPTLPHSNGVHYWFVAVSILGATITPQLFFFYSSGVIEEKWDASYVKMNRVIAAIGMGFGGFLSIAVLVVGALVFHPTQVKVDQYSQLPRLLTAAFHRPGFWLFAAALGIACLGATLEFTLSQAYLIAQGFGWNWGEDLAPHDDARFSLMYTLIIAAGSLFVLVGLDPLKLTGIAMALTAASLPVGVFPFIILMNDKSYLGEYTNGRISNAVVLLVSAMAAILALVSIPLELLGS